MGAELPRNSSYPVGYLMLANDRVMSRAAYAGSLTTRLGYCIDSALHETAFHVLINHWRLFLTTWRGLSFPNMLSYRLLARI